MCEHPVYIGCASWSIPSVYAARFASTGSHLERYSTHFRAVEINSSFYRPHKVSTYACWATTVPAGFRFAVKMPREITHTRRLRDIAAPLTRFLDDVAALGPTLGPLLVQLPPSLAFDADAVDVFFAMLRGRFVGDVVCEPRHVTWFGAEAEQLLVAYRIVRVAADPALVPQAGVPGGWQDLVYYRLHGSPQMYYSAYGTDYVARLAQTIVELRQDVSVWCIFDNTASGSATEDALLLHEKLAGSPSISG